MQTVAKKRSFADFIAMLKLLAPTIVGLMLARLGIIVSTYGSYNSTDNGLFTDGSTLFAIIPLIALFLYFEITKTFLNKHQVYIFSQISIAMQSASIVLLGIVLMITRAHAIFLFAFAIVITMFSWFSIFYWLRRARGTTSGVAVAIVFGALLLSEPFIYLFSLLNRPIACFIVGFCVLGQYKCQADARTKPLPEEAAKNKLPLGYFGFAERMVDTVKLFAVLAIGSFVLAIVDGALRGFPNGASIPFTPATRFSYMILLICIFSVLIWRSFQNSPTVMTTSIWLCLQALGMFALLCYSAWPDSLQIGAVFTTVFNAGMTGFMWYLVIAFSSCGSRDTYYYAAAGWIVFLLPRALVRITMIYVYPYFQLPALEVALIAGLILMSSHIVFTQLAWLEHTTVHEDKKKPALLNLQHILGLENVTPTDPVSMRRTLMESNTALIKEQFMLSDRETEILTLYALGLTQKKIAEELCISQGTTHTHIKRIYAKTNLHSRQEILDYIEQYANK